MVSSSPIIAKVGFLLTWINNLSAPKTSNLNSLVVNVVRPTPLQQKGTIKDNIDDIFI
jgi:hypothetical protein